MRTAFYHGARDMRTAFYHGARRNARKGGGEAATIGHLCPIAERRKPSQTIGRTPAIVAAQERE
jgi:hypothetical protein